MIALQSTSPVKRGPGLMRRYCVDCGACFDTTPGSAERCEKCAPAHAREVRAEAERNNQPPRIDLRFEPRGQQVKDRVILPGGLDGVADAYLWVMEIPPLVKSDPGLIGLRVVKGEKTYQIGVEGELQEVRQ